MTQRTLATLATFDLNMVCDRLIISADGQPKLEIPKTPKGSPIPIKVWRHEGQADSVDVEADAWFSQALGTRCRLVKVSSDHNRRFSRDFGGGPLAFSDAMPILVVSQASLDLLNSKLEQPIPMDRFRANIVVAGAQPHEEDSWGRIQIGDAVLRRTHKCGRCLVTTTDQRTGVRGVEPLRTLAEYRQEGTHVFFGCYYVPEQMGTLEVGAVVR